MLAFIPMPDVLIGPCLAAVPIRLCRFARWPVPGRMPARMAVPGGAPEREAGRGTPIPPLLLGRSAMARSFAQQA
eukprot:scaffold156974_cov31-Tisochrysis_lutea.AAC.2